MMWIIWTIGWLVVWTWICWLDDRIMIQRARLFDDILKRESFLKHEREKRDDCVMTTLLFLIVWIVGMIKFW